METKIEILKNSLAKSQGIISPQRIEHILGLIRKLEVMALFREFDSAEEYLKFKVREEVPHVK